MALTEKLTNIADAIRNKTGGTEALTLDQMVTEIDGITVGVPVDTKIFKFKHYTGEVLGEYTVEELAALDKLPNIILSEDVDVGSWGITLEEVKALLSNEYYAKFGFTFYPNYITKSVRFDTVQLYGDLEVLYYTIENELQDHKIDFDIKIQYDGAIELDWGDGSEAQYYTTTSNVTAQEFTASHVFSPPSYPYTYVIKRKTYNEYSQYPCSCLLKYSSKTSPYISGMIGNWGASATNLSTRLKFWLFTSGNPSGADPECLIYNNTTTNAFSLDKVANVYQPNVITGTTGGRYWYRPHPNQPITSYYLTEDEYNPPMIKGCYMFYGIDKERKSNNPKRLVGDYHIRIHPSTLTASFNNYLCGATYDYSSHTSVPTLSSNPATVFEATNCKVLVPSSLYNTWISATNWSAIADYIEAV